MKIAQSLNFTPPCTTPPCPTGFSFNGPLPTGRFNKLSDVVNNATPLFFAIAGIALFLYLTWGGFDFLTAMGDPKKAEAGKNKITHAIIGFVILFAAYWIVQIADVFLGFKIF